MRWFAIIFIITIQKLTAGEGVVLTLEAPFFIKPDTTSQIMQYARKGERIFIHSKYLAGGLYDLNTNMDEKTYNQISNKKHLKLEKDFYETLDKNGVKAYVPKKYVKIFYNDTRELTEHKLPIKHDETDYRLDEPLPKGYPLYDLRSFKTSILVGQGTKNLDSYNYSSGYQQIKYSNKFEIFGFYGKRLTIKKNNRLYFGIMTTFSNSKNDLVLTDSRSAEESWTRISAGPSLSYDFYRDYKNKLGLMGGFQLAYDLVSISQTTGTESFQRRFATIHFFPRIILTYQRMRIIGDEMDFVAGLAVDYLLNRQYKSFDETNQVLIWNEGEEDYISSSATIQASILFGLQKRY